LAKVLDPGAKSRTRMGRCALRRGAVERSFGWLKEHGGLLPLRVRGLEKVRLHVNLMTIAKLSRELLAVRGAERVGQT